MAGSIPPHAGSVHGAKQEAARGQGRWWHGGRPWAGAGAGRCLLRVCVPCWLKDMACEPQLDLVPPWADPWAAIVRLSLAARLDIAQIIINFKVAEKVLPGMHSSSDANKVSATYDLTSQPVRTLGSPCSVPSWHIMSLWPSEPDLVMLQDLPIPMVSSSVMFDRGIESCLKYIEAVPWNENEEEKLKHVFARCTFDEAVCKNVLARLQQQCRSGSEDLTVQLVESITSGTNNGARKEMQSLVSGLLSKSSVYHKGLSVLNKEGLYQICRSCLSSLVELFMEDSEPVEDGGQAMTTSDSRPMIERVSKQTENLKWLNNDMTEEYVDMWANQDELIRMHEQASPIFRYEFSQILASVFIALGKGRIQCPMTRGANSSMDGSGQCLWTSAGSRGAPRG